MDRPDPDQGRTNGFTLIELLLVVLIIAVLATIAVPNLLEAQTRSRVTRVRADQRSVATALEAYAVDARHYPAYGHPRDGTPPGGGSILVHLPVSLTTPVAYLTALPADSFPATRAGAAGAPFYYRHDETVEYLGSAQSAGHLALLLAQLTGTPRPTGWAIWSHGPDRTDDRARRAYDPTNGTLSDGDVMRFGP